jgi:hypothetical protein
LIGADLLLLAAVVQAVLVVFSLIAFTLPLVAMPQLARKRGKRVLDWFVFQMVWGATWCFLFALLAAFGAGGMDATCMALAMVALLMNFVPMALMRSSGEH